MTWRLRPLRFTALLFGLAIGIGALFIPGIAVPQTLTLDMDSGGELTGRIVQLMALLTILSLAPGILVMVTSFTRIVIVLSILRSALGVQQTPPNTVMISLALFLTAFIMAPTLQKAYETGVAPLIAEEIDEFEAWDRVVAPLRDFMLAHVREKDLLLLQDLSQSGPVEDGDEIGLQTLIPAFMISELRRAFEIGFLLFIPFIVIDMVVASVLMSMGMMMLPPIIISLPFKLIFFVLVDGWHLVTGSLVQSFAT